MAFALSALLLLFVPDLRPALPAAPSPLETPSPPEAAAEALCRVSLEPRDRRPGDVVAVTAVCDAGLVEFRATLGEEAVPFFVLDGAAAGAPLPLDRTEPAAAVPPSAPSGSAGSPGGSPPPDATDAAAREVAGGAPLGALVGLDLRTSAGSLDLVWKARFADGARASGAHAIEVASRTFPVQRLRLPRRMVAPDPGALERIAREALQLAAVLSAVSPERLWRGPFAAPVPDARGGGFGARRVLNGRPAEPHSGMDLRATTGTPVQAPNAAVVAFVDTLYYGGKTVVLDHGLGLFTTYSHLSQVSVMEGDSLDAGQLVGRVGATGRVTGPHLHWAVVLNGARVDPVSLMAATGGLTLDPAEVGPPGSSTE
jgi:murein DD-endopeptidase MepM/ murein hydrolase activator NlpD